VASKRRETHIASCSNIQKAFFAGFFESDGHLSQQSEKPENLFCMMSTQVY